MDTDNEIVPVTDYELVPATLKVTEKPVPVTGVTVTPSAKTLKGKGETFSITATVAPANATNKAVTYKSGDEKVATAVANGKTTITVTTADGSKTAKCEVTVDIPHKHTMTTVEKKEATCITEGNNEYYKCTECGKAYKDAENHVNVVVKDEIKATEEADGYTGDKVCEACGTEIEKGQVVPKLVHMADVTKVEAKAATEKTDGNIEYYICNSCGKLYKDAEGKTEITSKTPLSRQQARPMSLHSLKLLESPTNRRPRKIPLQALQQLHS